MSQTDLVAEAQQKTMAEVNIPKVTIDSVCFFDTFLASNC